MVSCEPYQSYKIPLKNTGQSVIEHNLVTIYLSLEWADNLNDNPNLLIHIFDKKTPPKPCKNESSMSYFQQNQSSVLVNSIHHHQENFGSTYQQQYYHHSSVINNEPPTTTTTITTGDHNDVSSTTTTVVFSALQPPPPTPPSSASQTPIQQIKNEVKSQLSPLYRRQQTSNTSPMCSSTNQQYLSSQHVIQTPSSNLDTQSNIQMSPTLKAISPQSSNNLPTKQTLTHVIDLQQSSPISSYPLSTTSASSAFKAFGCTCLKPHIAHEHNCPALTLVKQPSNTTLTSQTIVCRPPVNRTIAQRAAVASQIRTNRSISMTPIKDQGQTSSTTLFPFSISNLKSTDSLPNITTIVSQKQSNFPIIKKPIARQRSIGLANSRQRKKRLMKQISLPNGTNQDQSSFYNQIHLNDSKQQSSTFMIKEEHISSPNPTIKIVSPFSIQTTVTNSDIDQTIDDVINGKGDIPINESPQSQTKPQQQPPPPPQQHHPSSQLVWVQNGTVTTKTWLSPLYQKQQQQQQPPPVYDPTGSTLTHQDVVNIAQQVVFPTNTEQNQINTVLPLPPPPPTNNSKKKTRSKSINPTPLKRNRKPTLNRSQLKTSTSSQQEILSKPSVTAPITPIHNLINKPIAWSNIPPPPPISNSVTTTTNLSLLNSNPHLSSFDKNDSWQSQCVENVDSMLDEFQLVSIDEQRINSNQHFDFDLSIDGFPTKINDRFSSSTPPPPLPLTIDNNQRYSLSSTDKFIHPLITNSRLNNPGDVDVYDHFLNPYSSSIWQENQVTSSVSTPPDFHINHFPIQHQQGQQQYYSSSQTNDEHIDSYNPQSQATKKIK